MTDLDLIAEHYLVAALWSSTDDDETPLDSIFDNDDFTREAKCEARLDCAEFLRRAQPLLDQIGELPDGVMPTADQIGHDFWLTRNSHGVGFWDRPFEYGSQQIADGLAEIAYSFGEAYCEPYRGKVRVHTPWRYLDRSLVTAIDQTDLPIRGRTRSGYGGRLPTSWRVRIGSRWLRVSCMCWSNVGTLYVTMGGVRYLVDWPLQATTV